MKWPGIALYVFFFTFFAGVMVFGAVLYTRLPDPSLATASVEYIMRDVESTWLMRYLHSLLSELFVLVAVGYLALVIVFKTGLGAIASATLFLLLLGVEYFFGLFLPWGQMPIFLERLLQNLSISLPADNWAYVSFAHAIVIPLLLVVTSFSITLACRGK